MSRHLIEQLESRTLMSAAPALPSASLTGKVLTISGTSGSDMITVGLGADLKNVVVQMCNENGSSTRTFSKASFSTAVIEGGAGDDMLIVNEDFGAFVPTLMIGGAGSDLLIGGSANDLLVGDSGRDVSKDRARHDAVAGVANGILNSDKDTADAGNDILFGNGGHDALFGGRGSDLIFGGDGDDFLDGGDGMNLLIGEGGHNHIRAQSAMDLVIGNPDDVVDAVPGAMVF
jgi:Ca2+-binding RTX toxin-like protein